MHRKPIPTTSTASSPIRKSSGSSMHGMCSFGARASARSSATVSCMWGDQHSFLQLIVDGKRDKSVTVIKIKEFENGMRIPDNSFENLESMDIINGYSFSELINMQADSMIEALDSLDNIPLDVIEIESVNASEIGQLILYYELLTALVAHMLDINAYDQPGVEMGKIILKEKLRGK